MRSFISNYWRAAILGAYTYTDLASQLFVLSIPAPIMIKIVVDGMALQQSVGLIHKVVTATTAKSGGCMGSFLIATIPEQQQNNYQLTSFLRGFRSTFAIAI